MASSLKELNELHALIAKSLTDRIKADNDDGIPTDAATISAAIKFLKDNNVTADPSDADDLSDLRTKLKEQADARRSKVGNVISMAHKDAKEA